ncbi:class I SAM-dependent methyltransferase [Hyunsoonleella pacifica]|uniref:Class I SAM-dependent methyltransferase n=1 Tax=Hyunsoonleella pacifica TaxID=1080224 RepID=A0A4Q9FJH9_9FLAO|nr:class I SAM-dependent methyltransferase [Hyunsoonleella pacifica]TBN13827.1 class I SAM-dependent methyltransferase [Hyunsoonleella pacifica]GGD26019.1 hypothetical protein GCM10011368_30030 [Hyunsoonleella pacifica]
MSKLVNEIVKIDRDNNFQFLLKPTKFIYTNYLGLKSNISILKERLKGLDFTKQESLEKLGLSKNNSHHYMAGSSGRVKHVLNNLNISETDAILDFGCGKGKMLYVISKYPFRKVDGVEISETLSKTAKKNLTKLSIDKSTIYNYDARDFKDLSRYNYFYFFNPFPKNVMAEVIKNIEDSYTELPREITIIYYVPLYENEILKSGRFKKKFGYWDVFVYKNFDS